MTRNVGTKRPPSSGRNAQRYLRFHLPALREALAIREWSGAALAKRTRLSGRQICRLLTGSACHQTNFISVMRVLAIHPKQWTDFLYDRDAFAFEDLVYPQGTRPIDHVPGRDGALRVHVSGGRVSVSGVLVKPVRRAPGIRTPASGWLGCTLHYADMTVDLPVIRVKGRFSEFFDVRDRPRAPFTVALWHKKVTDGSSYSKANGYRMQGRIANVEGEASTRTPTDCVD